MMRVFEFDDYRKFLDKELATMPNQGFGQLTKMAKFIGVHPTLVSQILKGHKELTTDQAALVAEYLGMSEIEAEYFVLLVQRERAGNDAAKRIYRKQIRQLKEKALNISNRVTSTAKLTEEQRAVFYSDWAFTAVRQSTAIPGLNKIDSIADFLGIPRGKVQMIADFLVQSGLCIESQNRLKTGPASTYVESASPWARVHHANWRARAIQSLDSPAADDLHYTSPLTVSAEDCQLIREKILQLIEKVNEIVDPSPSEKLACLNLDWFQVGK